jgi:hypothetical protein
MQHRLELVNSPSRLVNYGSVLGELPITTSREPRSNAAVCQSIRIRRADGPNGRHAANLARGDGRPVPPSLIALVERCYDRIVANASVG